MKKEIIIPVHWVETIDNKKVLDVEGMQDEFDIKVENLEKEEYQQRT